jgi:hypothetical protein
LDDLFNPQSLNLLRFKSGGLQESPAAQR